MTIAQSQNGELDPTIRGWREDSEKAKRAHDAGERSKAETILARMIQYSAVLPSWAKGQGYEFDDVKEMEVPHL